MMKELRSEIEITASARRVWEILTDFAGFPQWNPFIRRARGNLVVGERLDILMQPSGARGMTFSPTVLNVETDRDTGGLAISSYLAFLTANISLLSNRWEQAGFVYPAGDLHGPARPPGITDARYRYPTRFWGNEQRAESQGRTDRSMTTGPVLHRLPGPPNPHKPRPRPIACNPQGRLAITIPLLILKKSGQTNCPDQIVRPKIFSRVSQKRIPILKSNRDHNNNRKLFRKICNYFFSLSDPNFPKGLGGFPMS